MYRQRTKDKRGKKLANIRHRAIRIAKRIYNVIWTQETTSDKLAFVVKQGSRKNEEQNFSQHSMMLLRRVAKNNFVH